ncbi:MAG: RluA family pseudouridine synthase [Chitinophagaceae bacterium]|nr:RluA family pseudouridine synthase [Chitinophagaceae bacterium]
MQQKAISENNPEEFEDEISSAESENQTGDELYERLTIKVDRGQEPLRIDKFLMARMGSNKIQQAIDAGMVTVNGNTVKTNYKIKPSDEIIFFSETHPDTTDIVPEPMDIQFVYEDDHVMVINKPAGLVVHPGSGNYTGTLVNGVAYHLLQQNPGLTEFTLPRFGLVHRIDKNTSGLLLMAKNQKALNHLAKQFFNHTIDRKYIALVWGNMENDEGTIQAHVGRNPRYRKQFEAFPDGEHGKHAVTHYRVLERFHYVTLVECELETGRTHQIRVHMKHIGHTLFADDHYGGDRILKGTVYTKYKQFVDNCFALCPRQALHAKTLGFIHPDTGKKMLFELPLPNDMEAVIDKWRRYYKAKGVLED